jgi:putative SOS response-associated peptidase YedK
MCNLYSHTSNRSAIAAMVRDIKRIQSGLDNLEPQPGIFPDYPAPIVRNTPDGRELAKVRWGLPSSQKALYDAASRRAVAKSRNKSGQIKLRHYAARLGCL